MKLTEITQPTVLWEDNACKTTIAGHTVQISVELNEDVAKINFGAAKPGVVSKLSGIAKSFFTNPFAVGVGALWAVDAIQRYEKNKRYTTHFYAKTAQEKQFHQKIVDDLMKTGHYKLIKSAYVDGGHLWVLQRTNR